MRQKPSGALFSTVQPRIGLMPQITVHDEIDRSLIDRLSRPSRKSPISVHQRATQTTMVPPTLLIGGTTLDRTNVAARSPHP